MKTARCCLVFACLVLLVWVPEVNAESEELADSQRAVTEAVERIVKPLSEPEQIAVLGKWASSPDTDPKIRLSALLLLGSYPDPVAVKVLLDNIDVLDYSLVEQMSSGQSMTTRSEYERLGMFDSKERRRLGSHYTPSVRALKKIGRFALPQILEYMKSAPRSNLLRSAHAIYLIIGNREEYDRFMSGHMEDFPKEGRWEVSLPMEP